MQDLGQREILAYDVHENVIRKTMETVLLPPARRVLQEARQVTGEAGKHNVGQRRVRPRIAMG
jgi:hypothetical protein